MTKDDLEKAVRAWFVAAVGMTEGQVWIDRISGPKPDRPFAVLTVSTPALHIGRDEVTEGPMTDDGDATVRITGHRRAMVSAQVFGSGAADYLEAAREATYLQAAKLIAEANDVVIQSVGDTGDLTGLLDTGWEERAVADIRVGWKIDRISETDATGTIERVVAEGTVGDLEASIDVEAEEE